MSRFHVICLATSRSAVLGLDVEQAILAVSDADISLKFIDQLSAFEDVTRADAVLHRGGFLDASVIQGLNCCRLIAHAGVGFDSIDLEAATKQGILVTNVPEYCVEEVSNHAFALLLALHRRLVPYSRKSQLGYWEPQGSGAIKRLDEATVAVVGYGRIGSAFGRKIRQLGARVLAVDPYVDQRRLHDDGVISCELEDALPEADFVSVHTPLTADTARMFGAPQFQLMKPSAYFINTARGRVVDELALIEALQNGVIAGAGIDVLVSEPPPTDNPLLHMDNVIVTPHTAYYSEEAVLEARRTTATQIADVLTGKWPNSVLNPALKSAFDKTYGLRSAE